MPNRRLSRAILATATAALLIAPLAYADHPDGGDGGNTAVSSSTTPTSSTSTSTSTPTSSGGTTTTSTDSSGSSTTSGTATISTSGSSTTPASGSSGTSAAASGSGSTDGEKGDAREAKWQAQFSQAFAGQSLSSVQTSLDASQTAQTASGNGSATTASSTQTAQSVLQTAQSVLGQDPNNAQALQAAGVAEADLGDHQKALADLQAAVALNPSATNTSYGTLGNLLAGAGDKGIKLFADGKPVSFSSFGQAPVIQDGRTLVPVRAIMAALGANVSWDSATQTVTITQGSTTVQLQIGSNTATVNGQTVTLDVPPGLMNGRTMLPIRFVAQMLGEQVQWYGSSQLIALTPPASPSPTGTTTGTVTGTVYGTAG